MRTKQKSLQLQASNVDTWWNLSEDMFQIDSQTLFDEHKANEANSRTRLKTYMKTYPEFKHESPSVTPEDNFNTLDFNQD